MNNHENLNQIIEAALLAAGKPLKVDALGNLFDELERPDNKQIREALKSLAEDYDGRGIEIVEVGSGWRIQVRKDYAPWVSRLWEEKPGRYSRALMETLALIAYRQPVTRGEIEEIRGVSVASNTMRTLLERDWVQVVGHRDVPGKPSLYATTKGFLDYFSLKSLDELPTLAEIRDLDSINRELNLEEGTDHQLPSEESDTDEGDAEVVPLPTADASDESSSIPESNENEIEVEETNESTDVEVPALEESQTESADDQSELPGAQEQTDAERG